MTSLVDVADVTAVVFCEGEIGQLDTNQRRHEDAKRDEQLAHGSEGAFELTRSCFIDKLGHENRVNTRCHSPKESAHQLDSRYVDLCYQVTEY